ncbi:MAG: Ig-like domain-containing protein [Lachnospiraceae bacterium]|nr:Ig-like domain-containing protein [Lachnospiraceae bacterium]
MKKWIKRVLISLMAVFLALGLIPFSASAAEEYDFELFDLSLGTFTEGYWYIDYAGYMQGRNNGTERFNGQAIKIELSGGDKDAFSIRSCSGGMSNPGVKQNLAVLYPREGLSPGTYTATVSMYYDRDWYETAYDYEFMDSATVTMTIEARFATHSVTVMSGTADKQDAAEGEIVRITAGNPPSGKTFDHWEVVSGNVTVREPYLSHSQFTMGDENVTVKACFVTKTVRAELIDLDLGRADRGYDCMDYMQIMYMKNTGTQELILSKDHMKIELLSGNGNAFVVDYLDGGHLAAGKMCSIARVRPAEGLSSGTYSATYMLSYDADGPGSEYTWQGLSPGTGTITFTVNPPEQHSITVVNGKADQTSAAAGKRIKITANASPYGQLFDHWEVVSGGVTLENATSSTTYFTMPDKAVKVRAVYVDEIVTVNFEPGAGTMPASQMTQTFSKGGKASRPADPVIYGADFDDWYSAIYASVPYDFNTPVEEDKTIYAKYTAILAGEVYDQATSTYGVGGKITYHYDQVVTSFAEEMYTDDYMLLSAEADPGYNFIGWKIGRGSCLMDVDDCVDYDSLDHISVTPYQHTTLVAIFEKIPTSAYSLSETSITVNTMSAHMLYLFAYGQKSDGIWSSSNPSVATVDNDGFVTGVSCGKCTIHVSSPDGTFQADCAVEVLFWDVKEPSSYYFKPVYWAAYHKPYVITKGYENGKYFGRGYPCTREDFILFIWRLAGQPKVSDSDLAVIDSKFSDASLLSSNNFRKAVAWGVKKGIIKGYTSGPYAGMFGVGLTVERKDALIMLYRYAGKPKWSFTSARPESGFNFTDVTGKYGKGSDTYNAIAWGYVNKITNGYSTTNPPPADYEYPLPCFGSTVPCQREQMITFLYRYDNLK